MIETQPRPLFMLLLLLALPHFLSRSHIHTFAVSQFMSLLSLASLHPFSPTRIWKTVVMLVFLFVFLTEGCGWLGRVAREHVVGLSCQTVLLSEEK